MIHPTAVVHPKANLDPTVEIAPYAVIDAHVTVGPNCRIGPFVHLTGHTTIGSHNQIHSGCVIGDAPQDLKYAHAPTRLIIGDHNVFREHVTIHRSNSPEEDSVIGSHCFFMAASHAGHNCRIGNHVIIANGALLAGHVTAEDRAFISGTCLVHQFVRIGTLSLMQGGSAVSKDLPPFTVARGNNGICGLNAVGLRRAGIPSAERIELKRLYHLLFRSGLPRKLVVDQARLQFNSSTALVLLDFVAASKRGVCADTSRRHSVPEPDDAI